MAAAGVLRFQNPTLSQSEGPRPAKVKKQRQRATLSCLECRRLKVECNRQKPCSHCIWSNRESRCVYCTFPQKDKRDKCSTSPVQGDPETTQRLASPPLSDQSSGGTDSTISPRESWSRETTLGQAPNRNTAGEISEQKASGFNFMTYRGKTHWAPLLFQVQEHRAILPNEQQKAYLTAKYLRDYPTAKRRSDFPFGNDNIMDCALSKSELIQEFLPSRAVCDNLIASYLDSIEGIYRLFHIPSLIQELELFWARPQQAEYTWLAQLFMMLAIGYKVGSSGEYKHKLDRSSAESLFDRLLRGAEVCLEKTSFIFKATTSTIRSLCLMAIAKLLTSFSCQEIDSCTILIDTALRMCRSIGLDRKAETLNGFDRQLRSRLWLTVILIKTQHAMSSGTGLPLTASDFDCLREIENLNDYEIESGLPEHHEDTYTDASLQLLLVEALPIAFKIVTKANDYLPKDPASEQSLDALRADAVLRRLLKRMHTIFASEDEGAFSPTAKCLHNEDNPNARNWKCLQRSMLEIFFRRLLLINYQLHETQIDPPSCMFSALECAFAILAQQRSMLEHPESTSVRLVAVAELFKQDFFIAGLVVCARWNDATCDPKFKAEESRTVLLTLHWCQKIWARDVKRSICHYWAHYVLERFVEVVGLPTWREEIEAAGY